MTANWFRDPDTIRSYVVAMSERTYPVQPDYSMPPRALRSRVRPLDAREKRTRTILLRLANAIEREDDYAGIKVER